MEMRAIEKAAEGVDLFKGPSKFRPASGEKVLWRGKPVLLAFFYLLLAGGMAVLTGLIAVIAIPSTLTAIVFAVAVVFCAAMFLLAEAVRRAHTFVLTNQRIRSEFRFWATSVQEAPLRTITNVSVFQDLVARVFGFGTIRADTAGTPFPGVVFFGVRDFSGVHENIRRAVDHYAK